MTTKENDFTDTQNIKLHNGLKKQYLQTF